MANKEYKKIESKAGCDDLRNCNTVNAVKAEVSKSVNPGRPTTTPDESNQSELMNGGGYSNEGEKKAMKNETKFNSDPVIGQVNDVEVKAPNVKDTVKVKQVNYESVNEEATMSKQQGKVNGSHVKKVKVNKSSGRYNKHNKGVMIYTKDGMVLYL